LVRETRESRSGRCAGTPPRDPSIR
jgi:hypothetical protein